MLNSAPYSWTINQLMNHIKEGPQAGFSDGTVEPARPYGMFTLPSRLRAAWAVFTGRADALFWPRQNHKAY